MLGVHRIEAPGCRRNLAETIEWIAETTGWIWDNTTSNVACAPCALCQLRWRERVQRQSTSRPEGCGCSIVSQ